MMFDRPFKFTSKAGTLHALRDRLTIGALCEQDIVTAKDWLSDRDRLAADLAGRYGEGLLIVRSSASNEDTWGSSMAGAHLSLADVAPEPGALGDAIDRVFESYTERTEDDEVLVQPMVADVAISGVVMTRDLDTGSPYYVVNYDDFSGRTDTVTGGRESITVLVHRSAPQSLRSPRLRKLLDCIIEVEAVTGVQELDIEFCIDGASNVFILQVRPLATSAKWNRQPDAAIDAVIAETRERLAAHMTPQAGLAGDATIFTEMTDWNPAEMIGNTPRPLALSLYKSLITDAVWAEARRQMGYRMVDGPLLIDFQGRPYIDVRKSFNSFLPAGIPDAVAGKLVNHQLGCLADNRELHDKVEFEICVTCWDFSVAQSRQRFADAGLSDDESQLMEQALHILTGRALGAGAAELERLIARADLLLEERPELETLSALERVACLLETCREQGTLIFSQLARHGFIGVQFLRSMVREGLMDETDVAHFMQSITTVATDLSVDLHDVYAGDLDRERFLERYGHLRPGTYDITSWRYDERPDIYLGHTGGELTKPRHDPFTPPDGFMQRIDDALTSVGYDVDAQHLLDYIAAAIKGREQVKFAFTKVVSDVLAILIAWGADAGLERDDLSFLPIGTILNGGSVETMRADIAKARQAYDLTRSIRLPHVILDADDVDVVRLPLGQPTFITNQSITSSPVFLETAEAPNIDGHIVMIESADPGFDWIFSHPISGLITKYGGANSHMAIRCAEFGLPAAIGCGERLFENMRKARVIELNAAAKRLSAH